MSQELPDEPLSASGYELGPGSGETGTRLENGSKGAPVPGRWFFLGSCLLEILETAALLILPELVGGVKPHHSGWSSGATFALVSPLGI